MFKKLFIYILILFSFYGLTYGDGCEFNSEDYIQGVKDCISHSNLVEPKGDSKIEGGFKDSISNWTKTIAGIFLLFAIGSIVYGGFLMTLSTGEEEKIKKGKDVVKWGILGALGIVSAATIITIIIEIMYTV